MEAKVIRGTNFNDNHSHTIRVRLNRVGGSWVGGSWVVGHVCLKIKKRYIFASSVLGPNLQLPAHELISPKSFYETLNKGTLSPIKH